jgi:hypothetical protein
MASGSINAILHLMGIQKGAARDEFDAIGLGRFRNNENWIKQPVYRRDEREYRALKASGDKKFKTWLVIKLVVMIAPKWLLFLRIRDGLFRTDQGARIRKWIFAPIKPIRACFQNTKSLKRERRSGVRKSNQDAQKT